GLIYYFEQISIGKGVYTLNATFSFGGDIQPGTPVRIAGYRVGEVRSVEWDSDRQVVRAVLEIELGYRIKEDAKLIVDTLGMLGEPYLEFTAGSPGKPNLKPRAFVHGEVPPSLTEIRVEGLAMVKKITAGVSEIEGLAAHLSRLAGDEDLQGNIRKTIQNAAKIAEGAVKSAESMEKISTGIVGIVESVRALVGKLDVATEKITKQIEERGKQAGTVLANATTQ
ncbi:unnamed protein product, partial [marine sediment metagenome]